MLKALKITGFLILLSHVSFAANLEISGEVDSIIRYEITQRISGATETEVLELSFVIPYHYRSPTYNQDIRSFSLKFYPEPDQRERKNKGGNELIVASWKFPPKDIDIYMEVVADNNTSLKNIRPFSPFPVKNVPPELKPYILATSLVQSDNTEIRKLSKKLTGGAHTTYQAVKNVLLWMAENINYTKGPEKKDAIYTLRKREGNCTNFSHLSAAIIRASGIPARIVNGIVFNKPLHISNKEWQITINFATGRHSWIEVWFEKYGWIPYNPGSKTDFYLYNRYVRIEAGVDNYETKMDGLLRWIQKDGSLKHPDRIESIIWSFIKDSADLYTLTDTSGSGLLIHSPEIR